MPLNWDTGKTATKKYSVCFSRSWLLQNWFDSFYFSRLCHLGIAGALRPFFLNLVLLYITHPATPCHVSALAIPLGQGDSPVEHFNYTGTVVRFWYDFCTYPLRIYVLWCKCIDCISGNSTLYVS
jgi:hypothetical protein